MTKAIETAKAALRAMYPDVPDIEAIAETAIEVALEALYPTKSSVVACYPWRTNADLIYDAWRLGYVTGFVYDATPGAGGLWSSRLGPTPTSQCPEGIEQITLNLNGSDFRRFSFEDKSFDTVFFDPPYKLNGNPDGLSELSKRYGVDVPAKVVDRHVLMLDGLAECIRISRKYVLVKCQDQVANGRVYWQTEMLTRFTEESSEATLVDRFDMLGHHIPQPMAPSERYPNGREQRHAHGRPSTLLVFERT